MRIIGWITTILIGCVVLVAIGAGNKDRTDQHEKRPLTQDEKNWIVNVVALKGLKAAMHDPSSFELIQVLETRADKSLCVTYRAKNGFGALRTYRFVMTPTTSANQGNAKFVTIWNKSCANKSSDDISHIRHAL